jgi:hypothetical protein
MKYPMLIALRSLPSTGRWLLAVVLSLAFAASAQLNYDTAWTYVYDGGTYKDIFNRTYIIDDYFRDVKTLPDGSSICVGQTRDSTGLTNVLLMKLDASGTMMWKKLYRYQQGGGGFSVVIAKNGDFIIGGVRYNDPLIIRTDTLGNIKWSSWYYDSINDQHLLVSTAIINAVRENRRGGIVCAVGDEYPDNGGSALNNYATYLELDSAGQFVMMRQWNNSPVCNIGGFDIEEAQTGQYFLSGNEGVYTLDSNGGRQSAGSYSFYLTGVGTVTNRVTRVKILRSGTPLVAGMAYEGNCWTNYNTLYYDAWWSPISGGTRASWDTAGIQGANDYLYDFTQLVNGNLVFVGKNGNTTVGGVWVFVTDSTGRNLLWQKQFLIPYRSADGRTPRPLSVCATSDTGFTVVGDYQCVDSLGAKNAFAAHFVMRTAAPTLVSPIASANNQPVSLPLVWNQVAGATSYHVQVSSSSDFSTLFADTSLLADSQLVISGLSNSTNYYWRVSATGGYGTSAWSASWRFATVLLPPSAPALVAPLDSAVIDVDSVRLRWNTGSPSVDRYLVEVATDTNMTTLVISDSSVTDTSRLIISLVNNTTYFWRVKAHNAAGWGSYSSETRFVTSFTGVLYNGNALKALSLRYSSGRLSYALPSRCFVSVKYYDVRGRMVGSFVNQNQGAGNHALLLPIASFTTGAYVQVFEAGEMVRKDRIMVVK